MLIFWQNPTYSSKVDFTALSPRVRLLRMAIEPARTIKLLVADDSITLQKVIKLALSSSSPITYEIRAVSNGDDAVEQLEFFRPDMVLIDLNLPQKNAYEFKELMNQNKSTQGIPVILKVGIRNEKIDEARFVSLGFKGRLEMPFDPSHLKKVLSDALGSDSQTSDFLPPLPEITHSFETPIEFQDPQLPDLENTDLENTLSGILKPLPVESDSIEANDLDIRSLTENTLAPSHSQARATDRIGEEIDNWNIKEKPAKQTPELPTLNFESPSFDLEPFPFDNSQQTDPKVTSETRIIQAAKKELSQLLNDKSNEALFNLPPKLSGNTELSIQKQVEQEIKKILPEIAERIVKQELKKLLDQIQ